MAQYTVTLSSQVDFAPSDEVREISAERADDPKHAQRLRSFGP